MSNQSNLVPILIGASILLVLMQLSGFSLNNSGYDAINVKAYYVYSSELDSDDLANFNNAILQASSKFKDIGKKLNVEVEPVLVRGATFEDSSFNLMLIDSAWRDSQMNLIFTELINNHNFGNDYYDYNVTVLVMNEMTQTGANFGGLIIASEALMENDINGGYLAHELLHSYGCEESTSLSCFMRNPALELNNETLCGCVLDDDMLESNKRNLLIHISKMSSLSASYCASNGVCII